MTLTLTTNRWVLIVTLGVQYIVQGLIGSYFSTAIAAYLINNGHSTGSIGAIVAITSLPWTLKIILSPIVDRFSFSSMGRRRPWILASLIGIMLAVLVLSIIPTPESNIFLMSWVMCCVNLFVSLHDISIDGLAVDLLNPEDRTSGTVMMSLGNIAGFIVGAIFMAEMLEHFGFQRATLLLLPLLTLIAVPPTLLRERVGERIFPWSDGDAVFTSRSRLSKGKITIWYILKQLRIVFISSSLLLVVFFFLAQFLVGTMGPISKVFFIKELRWNYTEFSQTFGVSVVCASIFGAVLSLKFANRLGHLRVLAWSAIPVGYGAITFGLLRIFWSQRLLVVLYLIVTFVFLTVQVISAMAVAMHLCSKRIGATQYSMYMTIINMANLAGAAIAGPIDNWLDMQTILISGGFIYILLPFLLVSVDLQKWDLMIDRLEKERLESKERDI